MKAILRLLGLTFVGALLPACGSGGGGTLNPTVAPGIPAGVTAVPGNRSVTVSWIASAGGSSYSVLRSLTSLGPFLKVSNPDGFVSPTSYVDSGLSNGTTYYYVVEAQDSFGESAASPVASATPAFKAIAISTGSGTEQCMALMPDGTVWVWGESKDVPIQVPDLRDVVAIAAGSAFSLALRGDGSVWAWGLNTLGQLGIGSASTTPVANPVQVQQLTGVTAIAAGQTFGLALKDDGTVWGWGDNSTSQLGNGLSGTTPVTIPVQVQGLDGVTAIAAGGLHEISVPSGYYSMALRNDGTVWAWGDNIFGELGNGSATSSTAPVPTPVQVKNLTEVTAIATGQNQNLALRNDGTIWSWGTNLNGELENGTSGVTFNSTPAQITSFSQVVIAVSAGQQFSLAVLNDGTVWGWGNNDNGQLGTGSTSASPVTTPVQAQGLTGVRTVQASVFSAIAQKEDGSVWTWGTILGARLAMGPDPSMCFQQG